MKQNPLIIRPKGEDGYKIFSIRIKEELVERIDAISAKTGRSRNELIGTFVEYALENCVVDDNAEPGK